MRASKLFFPTLREVPKDAELVSHQLLLRGGFIRSVAAGVYSYLPLGWRVHEKISQIVREEIDGIGGQELHMPVLVPKELLDETGRSAVPVLFALKDKNQREFFLGFTHEEVVTDIIRTSVSSWKQMPLYLYQIQTKERDEPRPRGGLIRGREFTMFDGYSFDSNSEGLNQIYRANYEAYGKIFMRCGLEYLAVEADPGAIGGGENHEFMVLTENGEDTVLRCEGCGYAANAERAEVRNDPHPPVEKVDAISETISTPGARTIEEVCTFMGVPPQNFIKTMVCKADGQPVLALVRGDRELNLPKFVRAIGAKSVELADAETVVRVTGAPVGFAGPIALKVEVPIYADNELDLDTNYVVGANEVDTHRNHVTPGYDFQVTLWGDIRTAVAGDTCPRCGKSLLTDARGIEVGHIFKLETKYTIDMSALFQDVNGEKKPILMGCYGLGVSRTMASAVEAHSDEKGIIWPMSIAPYEVVIVLANAKDNEQVQAGERLYAELKQQGIDVLYDDREERIGVKFKDAEIIGIPVQVVVGKGITEGVVEVGLRRSPGERERVAVAIAVGHITEIVGAEKASLK